MTALPDTPFVARPHLHRTTVQAATRPNVTEHFWGYEVRLNEQELTVAVLMRAVSGIVAVAAVLAVVGIWLVPQMAFSGEALGSRMILSVALIALALLTARIAARGTRVRVQFDKVNGELREVVDGPMDRIVVLAHYGLDAVEAVEIVPSKSDPTFGQVQITLNGLGKIPAGDGAISSLGPLLDRIRYDCAIGNAEKPQPAIWSGPLAA